MRQVLLRVPDELHARLTSRAAREGRSVNRTATDILLAAVDADEGDRRERLVAQAAALGILRPGHGSVIDGTRRQQVIRSTKGTGPIIDRLIDEERDRL